MSDQHLEHFLATIEHVKQLKGANSQRDIDAAMRTSIGSPDSIQAKLWRYVFDPHLTYGIKKVPKRVKGHSVTYVDTSVSGVFALLESLASRDLSGDAAADVVAAFAKKDDIVRQVLSIILDRSPRCGVAAGRLNAVFPGLIPAFQVMLASAESDKRLTFVKQVGAYVDVKYDGFRRIAIHDKAGVRLYQNGGEIDHSFPYVEKWIRDHTHVGTVLDGELIYGPGDLNSRQTLSKHVGKTKVNEDDSCGVRLVVFDVLPLHEWLTQRFTVEQTHRSRWTQDLPQDGPVIRGGTALVSSLEEVETTFLDLVDRGYEGVIVKNPVKVYECQRSHAWVKKKYEDTEDMMILEVLPGDEGKKYADTFGRFYAARKNGVKVLIGPGKMTSALRAETWSKRDSLPGAFIEVTHGGETDGGSLIHPRFLRFRPDKRSF